MPYRNERANKTTHYDFINNPDVREFLAECKPLTPPSPSEGKMITQKFKTIEEAESLPAQVIAVDGSYYESHIEDKFPSIRVGYVKIGCTLIKLAHYNDLIEGKFVNPFKVAKLQNDAESLAYTFPSSNVKYKGKNVRDGFRAALDTQLYTKYRLNPTDPSTSIRATLFKLAAYRPNQEPGEIKLHKCPTCEAPDISVYDIPNSQHCPNCNEEVYPSDVLRIWETVTDYQPNGTALSRFMQVIEHLLVMHYIYNVFRHSPRALSETVFFVDGPLAIFGPSAWLSRVIMQFLAEINERLSEFGLPPVLIIGLQKSGIIADHIKLIEKFIPQGCIFAIDDDYRYTHIVPERNPAHQGFGYETYYGQDFIYRTPSGRTFVFSLPYPFSSKDSNDFVKRKTDISLYVRLPLAIKLIHEFECDLYENAIVPVALAHKYTAISLVPGARVLDLLTRSFLE